MSLSGTFRSAAPDPVGAVAWRNRTVAWRSFKYSLRTGVLPIILLVTAIYGSILVPMNIHFRGSPGFLEPWGLSLLILLDLLAGGMLGLSFAGRLFSRRWDDLLLPIAWNRLVRERRRRGWPWILGALSVVPVLFLAESVPVPTPGPLAVRLFVVLLWASASSALTAYWLVIGFQIWLGRLPRALAVRIVAASKWIALTVTYGVMAIIIASLLNNWSGGALLLVALTSAPMALVLASRLSVADLVGMGVSAFLPMLLAILVGPREIRLRLPETLFLASEHGGALATERPPKPGFWTDLRLRLRADYRDLGSGPRAVTGLLLTLGLRGGVGPMLVLLVSMFGAMGIFIGAATGDWGLALLTVGGALVLVGVILGILFAAQANLQGTPGTYSAARLLPFSGAELFRSHGSVVWPIQLLIAAYVGVYVYFVLGGPTTWMAFGTILTTELLATWGFQTGAFSGAGGPHGTGISTGTLQVTVGLLALFLLYPAEGYLAFSLTAATGLLLSAEFGAIAAVNVLLMVGLTGLSIRRYRNPPAQGVGTGVPPRGLGSS